MKILSKLLVLVLVCVSIVGTDMQSMAVYASASNNSRSLNDWPTTLMRLMSQHGWQHGYTGGVPTFEYNDYVPTIEGNAFQADRVWGGLFFNKPAVDFKDVPQTALDVSSLDALMLSMSNWGRIHGYWGGIPTFQTADYGKGPVWGGIFFKKTAVDFKDIPQSQLDDVSNVEALTRSIGRWGWRHGYKGGVPTFQTADYGKGPVWGGLFFKSATVDFQDVHESDLGVPPVQLTWDTMHSGDCAMYDATLIFHADGSGLFSSRTATYHTHSGDIWHIRFDIKDQHENNLFGLGEWDSQRMSESPADIDDTQGSYTTPFNVSFTYDPAFYTSISTATAHSSC